MRNFKVYLTKNSIPRLTGIILSDKTERLEAGLEWVEWYERNRGWVKETGTVLILLLAWLVIRVIKEEIDE